MVGTLAGGHDRFGDRPAGLQPPNGSYADAGLVTGAYVVGAAVASPVLGRLADSFGRRVVLIATGAASAVGLSL